LSGRVFEAQRVVRDLGSCGAGRSGRVQWPPWKKALDAAQGADRALTTGQEGRACVCRRRVMLHWRMGRALTVPEPGGPFMNRLS